MATKQIAGAKAAKSTKIEKQKTQLHHIFLIDWNDDGMLKEVAVVMETDDGVIYGIEVDRMHNIDKSRLKKIVTSGHADKYTLWELMSQARLNNGLNALDFFHANYVKVKRPRGSISGIGSLATLSTADYGDSMIAEQGEIELTNLDT